MTVEKGNFIIRCRTCATANRVPAASEGKAGRCGSCRGPLDPLFTRPVELTDRSFDPFMQRFHGNLLVEFWAPWCPHCRNFAPVLEEAAMLSAGSGVIVQVNTQENPQLAARFNISGVPTLVVFHNGKETERVSGAMEKKLFLSWWEGWLK